MKENYSAFTLAEGRPACTNTLATAKEVRSTSSLAILSRKGRGMRAAFTLAEVLITLAIIGVVAVLTIPGLIKNHNEKAWSTAQSVFEKRLEVATKQMNTEEKLAGYSSTMDFVNELKKYIKITKVCDNNELTKCFEKKIVNASGVEYNISELSSSQFTKDNWGTETIGVQFANSVNALIAYNPNTKQEPFNNQFGASASSMAILYDVSGNKNPNTIGKDISMNANVKPLGCMIKPELLGGMCINQILAPGTGYTPMTKAECEQAVSDGELGIQWCYFESDYWAGAVAACGGTDKLPSVDEGTTLARWMYNNNRIGEFTSDENLTIDTTKASQLFTEVSNTFNFSIWTDEEAGIDQAWERIFKTTMTDSGNCVRSKQNMALCIE